MSKVKKKVFITGASGLVGSNLTHCGKKRYNITATYHSFPYFLEGCHTEKVSLADNEGCESILTKYEPDFVIHSAAYTDLAGCETNRDRAWQINVRATENIARTCEKIGAKLVYISTDWVFDGKKPGKYTEEDQPSPLGYYGQTKWEGEKVLPQHGNWIVVRIANIYGWNYAISNKSFPRNHCPFLSRNSWAVQILHKLIRGESVSIPQKIYQTPTLASDLAKRILEMCEMNIKGLFHVCGSTCVNRYEFVIQMAEIFGINSDLVKSGTMGDLVTTWGVDVKESPYFFQTIPVNTCLDTTKLRMTLGKELMELKGGLQTMKSELQEIGFYQVL